MQFSMVTTVLNFIVKIMPFVEKAVARFTDQKLRGMWCTCWQNEKDSKEYQIGTVSMSQMSKAVSGMFFSGSGAWPFKAEFSDGKLKGTYKVRSNTAGFFSLGLANNGNNCDRLIGTWTGLVTDPVTGNTEETSELKICMGRGPTTAHARCHIKTFGQDEGHCTRSA
jgi:hypothetical protein